MELFKSTSKMRRQLLSPKEVEQQYNITIGTLQFWRQSGFGPAYLKLNTVLKYQRGALETWLNQWAIQPIPKSSSYEFKPEVQPPDFSNADPLQALPFGLKPLTPHGDKSQVP